MAYFVYVAKAKTENFDFEKIEFRVLGKCRIPYHFKLPKPLCEKEEIRKLYWDIAGNKDNLDSAFSDYPNASLMLLSKTELIEFLNQEKHHQFCEDEYGIDFSNENVQSVMRLRKFATDLPCGDYVLIADVDVDEIKKREQEEELWRDAIFD